MRAFIPAVTVKAALAGFAELGLDSEQLLAQTHLTRDRLNQPFASVPDQAFTQIWASAFAQMPDPTLPSRAGFAVPNHAFGILDHLVTTADSVGTVLQMIQLFFWLVSVDMTLVFTHEKGDWIWVDHDDPSGFISESWTLAIIVQRMRHFVPGFAVDDVWLTQKTELPAAQFHAIWGVPVQLQQPRSGIRLADGVWQLVNPHANPELKQTLQDVVSQVEIKQFEDAPLVYAVRTRLPEVMAREGQVSAESLAQELGLSKRTLQRRLSAENVTFKQLLDLHRQEQAHDLLSSGERDMGRIAYQLGYNEQSSFNRAFKRWTGKSPTQYLRA